jgi:uncharacterized protein (DUF4415 family)
MSDRNPYDYRKPPQVRMSLNLPSDVIAWVRAEAKRYGMPISAVVRRAIEDDRLTGRKP